MKENKNTIGILFFLFILSCGCRKDITGSYTAINLSIDSLSTITPVNIPAAKYTDAAFTSEVTGYAISNNGMIIKTADGGHNWTLLSSSVSFFLEEIQFTDTQTGYVIGGDATGSYLLKTTDAGNTWTTINLSTTQGGSPAGMFFIDNNKGFITGAKFFIKTTDGGLTWADVLPGNTDDFYDVRFNNNNKGIATTVAGAYYNTNDGGATWQRHQTGEANALRDICFAGTETYLRSGTKLINSNAGKPSITIPAAVQQPLYIDDKRCIGIGQHYETGFWPYGDIFITNNNWTSSSSKKYMPDEALSFSAVAKMSERKFIMLGTGHLKVSVVTIQY